MKAFYRALTIVSAITLFFFEDEVQEIVTPPVNVKYVVLDGDGYP